MVAKGRKVGCFTSICWQAFSSVTLLNKPFPLMNSAMEAGSREYLTTVSRAGHTRGQPSVPVLAD